MGPGELKHMTWTHEKPKNAQSNIKEHFNWRPVVQGEAGHGEAVDIWRRFSYHRENVQSTGAIAAWSGQIYCDLFTAKIKVSELIKLTKRPCFRNQKHLVIETMSYTNILRKERVTQFEENLAEMLLKNAHANGIDNVLGMALQRTGDVFHRFTLICHIFTLILFRSAWQR